MAYKDPVDELLYKARVRAKNKNLSFSIEYEDVVIPDYCPILHIPLHHGKGHSWSFSPTLDRINNAYGYIKGNVHVISALANQMKSSATEKQMFTFAKWVINRIEPY